IPLNTLRRRRAPCCRSGLLHFPARCVLRLACWRRGDVAGDEAGAALKREVGPDPVQGHCNAIAKADQIIDVGRAPHDPAYEALEVEAVEICNRRAASNRGEVAVILVTERLDAP